MTARPILIALTLGASLAVTTAARATCRPGTVDMTPLAGPGGGSGPPSGGFAPVCLPPTAPPPPRWQGPCQLDAFFIERPLWVAGGLPVDGACPSGVHDRTFAGCLAAAMTTLANAHPLWFCADAASCDELTRTPLVARVEPVLAARPAHAWRSEDAHQRYYRLTFTRAAGTSFPRGVLPADPLPVRPGEGLCTFMTALRQQARDIIGRGAADGVLIGRECSVMPAEASSVVAANPSGPMARWHLDRMNVVPPPPHAGDVDVALIDTGVDAALVNPPHGSSLPVAGEQSLVDDYSAFGAPHHRHGTAMALFIRSLAPYASIHSYRALDERGIGNTASLAAAIDQSVEDARVSRRPTVINLSVGWAPELSKARVIEAPYQFLGPPSARCETYEDGVGASVAFALDVARRRADDGAPLFVAAAVGNRPLRPAALEAQIRSTFRFQPVAQTAGASEPCAAAPQQPEWFFPGALGRRATCRSAAESRVFRETVLGVSGVDAQERPIGVGIIGTEAALVAPAEHVYAQYLGAGAPQLPGPSSLGCGHPSPDFPALRLPTALSGSSVATAFVAGAAARAQAVLLGRGDRPLSWAELEAALYLSGDALCRTNEGGVPVRRLSVARLDALLDPGVLSRLRACAPPVGATVRPGLLDACAAVVAALRPLETACPMLGAAVGWGAYHANACAPPTIATALPFSALPVRTCGGGPCAFERAPTADLVGALGPQPTEVGCTECLLRAQPYSGRVVVDLELELYPDFLEGTTFESATLVVEDLTRGPDSAVAIPLDDLVDVHAWKPGDAVVIKGVPTDQIGFVSSTIGPQSWADIAAVWTKQARARLYLKISSPDHAGEGASIDTLSISSLRVSAE